MYSVQFTLYYTNGTFFCLAQHFTKRRNKKIKMINCAHGSLITVILDCLYFASCHNPQLYGLHTKNDEKYEKQIPRSKSNVRELTGNKTDISSRCGAQ